MKANRFMLFATVIICLTACTRRAKPELWYNQIPTNRVEDKGILNPLNKDNKIYKSGSVFDYSVSFQDSTGKQYDLALDYTGSLKEDSLVLSHKEKSKAKNKKSFYINIVRLVIDSTNSTSPRLANSQTLIRFKYMQEKDAPFSIEETTGMVEDSSRIFLHPPRSFHFQLLELCPFPQVYLPLKVGKKMERDIKRA